MAQQRTVLPNSREFPRFAGVCTFARYPQICHVADKHQPVDWAIYGCPFDGGVTYRPGARFGPRAIRDASQYIKNYHLEHDVTVTDVFSLADGGDAPVRPYSCKDTADAITDYASKLGDPAHTKLLALGGDHSIAYANIRATWARRGKPKGGLALIHFDAHLDTVDSVWGEKWGHASPFIRAIEDGLIDPTRMISIGIRGPLNTKSDLDYAQSKGIRIVTADQWREGSGRTELHHFVSHLEGSEAYLSFDIDVADPVFAPGTGTPAIGGFTSAEILGAANPSRPAANIVGADVVEVLPDRDVSQVTALLASQVAFEILAIDAVRSAGP